MPPLLAVSPNCGGVARKQGGVGQSAGLRPSVHPWARSAAVFRGGKTVAAIAHRTPPTGVPRIAMAGRWCLAAWVGALVAGSATGRVAPQASQPATPESHYGASMAYLTREQIRHERPNWLDDRLYPANESRTSRIGRYRQLQAWFRDVQLGAAPGVPQGSEAQANLLDREQIIAQPDLNFLHPEAYQHALERAVLVQLEGGELKVDRLFRNMLSSMPMCFNLFGSMRAEKRSYLPVFRRLFDMEATEITDIVCEWAPRPEFGIGDHSAFDAIVFYKAGTDDRFYAIETKYTEPFSPSEKYKASQPGKRYAAATTDTGWFDNPHAVLNEDSDRKPGQLWRSKTNQLWRNVMLAAWFGEVGNKGRGSVAVVALADDTGAKVAHDLVRAQLSQDHRTRLRLISLEDINKATWDLAPDLRWWAFWFRTRYLDWWLPRSHMPRSLDWPQPVFPRLGRPLSQSVEVAQVDTSWVDDWVSPEAASHA